MPAHDPDDLTLAAEHLRAETAVVQAHSELVKAKAAVAGAGRPGMADARAAAENTQAQARETADAGQAHAGDRRAAEQVTAPAASERIVRSGIEGVVQVRNDAAKGEATLLSSHALTVAADRIAAELAATEEPARVVLAPCGEHLKFNHYRQFLMQTDLLRQIFRDTARTVEMLPATDQAPEAEPQRQRPSEAAREFMPSLALAGSVVMNAADLGSYFLTNYETGGVAVAPANVDQLVSALGGSLVRKGIGVILFGRRPPRQPELTYLLGDLPRQIADTEASIAELGSRIKKTKQAAEQTTDQAAKNELQEAAALLDHAAARCRSAITRAGDLIAALATADAGGELLMTKVAQEKAVCDELISNSALMLAVDVCATVGGYYTRKNLWTFFGTMPLYTMGGAVVTYQLLDKDGMLRASGLVPIHSGYRSISEVERLVNAGRPIARAPARREH